MIKASRTSYFNQANVTSSPILVHLNLGKPYFMDHVIASQVHSTKESGEIVIETAQNEMSLVSRNIQQRES